MGVPAASGYPQYSGNIINPLFAMDLLEQFYCSTIHSDISTTEYTGQLEKQGDQITFWREPEVRVRDTVKNQAIEHDTIESEPVTMVIDRAKDFSIKFSQIDEKQIQNFPKWKEAFLRRAGYRLGQAIDQDLLVEMYTNVDPRNEGITAGAISGNIDFGETGSPISLNSTNITQKLAEVHQALDELCAPKEGRFVILPPVGVTALRNSDLRAAYLTALNWSPLVNGRIPDQVMGFTIMESVNVPTVIDPSTSNRAYHIVAGTKMATAFAAQIEQTRVIEDKDEWSRFYQGLMVYGFKVLYEDALVHMYAEITGVVSP